MGIVCLVSSFTMKRLLNTTIARERVTASQASTIAPAWLTRAVSFTSNPTSRNTSEFRTKATYSQNETTASRVEAVMPMRAPQFPDTIPATTQAMTPEKWSSSAMMKEPYATSAVSVISGSPLLSHLPGQTARARQLASSVSSIWSAFLSINSPFAYRCRMLPRCV